MITRDETTLSEADYNRLKENKGFFAKRVTLYRRNLQFSSHDTTAFTAGYLFDAAQYNGKVWRVYIDGTDLKAAYLASEDLGNQTWQVVTTIDTGVDRIRPSIGHPLNVYYIKGDALMVATTEDNGTTWDLAERVDLTALTEWSDFDAVTHIAADGYDRCFVAFSLGSNTTTTFYTCYEWQPGGVGVDPVWSSVASGIYWPHLITGMDAESLGAAGDSTRRSVIAITSDLPVEMAVKLQGTEAKKVPLRRNGIVTFLYRGLMWSDHFTVERFDDASTALYRQYPFLTRLNDPDSSDPYVVLSAYGSDGRPGYGQQSLHYHFSKNGKHWTQMEMAVVADANAGGVIVPNSKYTYLVTQNQCHRSYTTELTGIPASNITEDITHRIEAYETSQANGRSSSLKIRNDDGWYDTSLLAAGGIFSLVTELGIYIGSTRTLQKIAHEIIDTWRLVEEIPGKVVAVQARDLVARLGTDPKSVHARLTDNQVIGADKYVDTTDTGYGGLAHTAAMLGSWSTDDQKLQLKSHFQRGMAQMTFAPSVWNGSTVCTFQITEESEGQYAGIFFRAIDKDNAYAAVYQHSSDEIKLWELRSGTPTLLKSSLSALNWDDYDVHHMRVTYRYSLVRVDISTDGKSWTKHFEYMLPGKTNSFIGGQEVMYEEGATGLVGFGFSSHDDWNIDPGDYNPSPWYIDPSNIPGDALVSERNTIAAITESGYLHITTNFLDTTPSWVSYELTGLWAYNAKGTYETSGNWVTQFVIDARSPGYLGTGSAINGWIITRYEIWHIGDIFGTRTLTRQKAFDYFTWNTSADFCFGPSPHGVVVTHGSDGTCAYYTTNGTSWTKSVVTSYYISETDNDSSPGCHVSTKRPGYVYTTAYYNSHRRYLDFYWSDDYGATWTRGGDNVDAPSISSLLGPSTVDHRQSGDLHVPYHDNDSELLIYFSDGIHDGHHFWRYNGDTASASDITITYTDPDDSITRYLAPSYSRWKIVSSPTNRLKMGAGVRGKYTWDPYYVAVSSNGGTSWSVIKKHARRIAISGDNEDALYVFGEGSSEIYFSTNFGVTLLDKKGNSPSHGRIIGICGGTS